MMTSITIPKDASFLNNILRVTELRAAKIDMKNYQNNPKHKSTWEFENRPSRDQNLFLYLPLFLICQPANFLHFRFLQIIN